jgi:hypothetical protein
MGMVGWGVLGEMERWGVQDGRKRFFFEKKKQKTLHC